ncbi:PAS domain S-box protein [Pseudoduganella violaceinigra]|uniref:PAS domain S-box protein n=1 Tax=Pseudoduganella violaceinigra TaxID=246602 RepID=UPI00041A2456|nr:PAS domain S-box protein [Pseudoduganella violaceinigra]
MENDLGKFILEEAPGGIIATDADDTVIFWTKGATEIYGYSAEETLGCKLADLIGIPDHPFKREFGADFEYLRRCKDGQAVYVGAACKAVLTDQGEIEYVIHSQNDITDAKALRDARQVESRYRGLLESMPDAIVMANSTGRIVLVNSQAERLFGFAPRELLGRPVEVLLPNRFRGGHASHRAQYFVQPRTRTMGAGLELYGLRKDGLEFPVEISLSMIQMEEGAIVMSAIRDIGDRKKAEQKFRGLLESAPDPMVIVNARGEIVLVNSQTEQLFGYQRQELLGKPIEILIPARFAGRHPAARNSFFDKAQPRAMGAGTELYAMRRDGSEFPVEISLSPLRTEDELLVSSAIRDISGRRQIERKLLEQKLELEQASKAKDRFLASMSHELRTPLNAILGFGQLLHNEKLPLSQQQRYAFAGNIVQAGQHLLHLINETLDLAKIEVGAVTLSLEPVALDELLHEARKMIEAMADARQVTVYLSEPRGLCVKADRIRLRQIVLNLLTNAVKYNSKGGHVWVAMDRNALGRTWLAVKDDGPGLSEEQLAGLFQPFNRLGQEGGSEEGSGIGLVLSKRLAELMNATIGVSSTMGKGCTFTVEMESAELPSALIQAPHHGASLAAPQDRHGKPLLLYVEDNPANLKLVQEIVKLHLDLELLSATDGNAGVAMAREHLPDVILMDMNLPGISGREAQRRLRQDPATCEIPIIALSANAMPLDVQAALEAGFFRYLTKPLDIGDFLEVVGEALEQSH